MHILPKIVKIEALLPKIEALRKKGKTIVFTNGCFDIIHAGHVRYLDAARQQGDLLVVGMNSDRSVKLIKDENRPIVSEKHRSEVLAGLESVDYVLIFDEPDPLRLICDLKPDVLVKGSDWAEEDIIGADNVKERGGKVIRIDLLQDLSTSLIIQTIVDRYGSD